MAKRRQPQLKMVPVTLPGIEGEERPLRQTSGVGTVFVEGGIRVKYYDVTYPRFVSWRYFLTLLPEAPEEGRYVEVLPIELSQRRGIVALARVALDEVPGVEPVGLTPELLEDE